MIRGVAGPAWLFVAVVAWACGGRPAADPPIPQPAPGDSAPPVPSPIIDSLPAGVAQLDSLVIPRDRAALDTVAVDSAAADTAPASPPPLRLCAGGDVLIGNNLDTTWAGRASRRLGRWVDPFPDPDSLLAPLRPLVADADVVLLNVEGAIGTGPAPSKCRPGSTTCYAFRQEIGVAGALVRLANPASFVANVANNHAMDAGAAGFRETIRHLGHAGAYVTGADSNATVVVTPGGDSVAILGFSTFQAGLDARDLEGVTRLVARARARTPLVVVTVHMGAEGGGAQRTPNVIETFVGENRGNPVAFARAAVAGGAAAVIGHGPHVMRGMEWWDGAFVAYSLGNLLTYGPFTLSEPNNRGAIACVDLAHDGSTTAARVRSTVQELPGVVRPDPSGRAAALADSLSRLDFPVTAGRALHETWFAAPTRSSTGSRIEP